MFSVLGGTEEVCHTQQCLLANCSITVPCSSSGEGSISNSCTLSAYDAVRLSMLAGCQMNVGYGKVTDFLALLYCCKQLCILFVLVLVSTKLLAF